jgi:hypothetical protein
MNNKDVVKLVQIGVVAATAVVLTVLEKRDATRLKRQAQEEARLARMKDLSKAAEQLVYDLKFIQIVRNES